MFPQTDPPGFRRPDEFPMSAPSVSRPSLLITAGPTWEPVDAVRYLGNRSSGRLGLALADEAARRGHPVTLLLGPVALPPPASPKCGVHRFETASELQNLLKEHWPGHEVLIMAAAVADYRPAHARPGEKIRRREDRLTLELEPVPDVLADLASHTRPDQRVIGFALEPEHEMLESARRKLQRKGLHAIVANPLSTMNALEIRGMVVLADGRVLDPGNTLPKDAFAEWLLDQLPEISAANIRS